MRTRQHFCVSAITLVLLLAAGSARANLITLVITGTVIEVTDPSSQLEISVGDTYTATLTIEGSLPNGWASQFSPGFGQADIVYGAHHYSSNVVNSFFADTAADPDSYAFIGYDYDPNNPPSEITTVALALYTLASPTASNAATAAEVPWDGDWGYPELSMYHVGPGPTFAESAFDSLITSMTVVPEPGTVVLLALGIASLRRVRAR